LPAALRQTPGLLMSDAMTLIQIGQQTGAMAAALRQAATVEGRYDPTWANLVGKIFYLAWLPSFGLPVVVFIMFWIIPKFQAMFRSFGVELPEVTRWLIDVSDWFIDYWFLPAPFILASGFLFLYMVLRYFGWIRWDLPGISRLVRRLDSARILDCLAIVARQQKPLGDGIGALARCYPKAGIRWRLAIAAVEIDGGRDWTESLYDRRLIRSADRAVFQAAQRAGNLAWALAEAADSSRRRFAYRLQAIVQAAFPVAVIGFGLAVMFIVVGLFYPLVELIKKLA
jgi:type II secretory pathway component PulF